MATALLEPMLRPAGNFRKCSMRRYGLGWEFGTLSVWASAPSHSRLPATMVAHSTAARTAILIRSFPREVPSAERHYTRAPAVAPDAPRQSATALRGSGELPLLLFSEARLSFPGEDPTHRESDQDNHNKNPKAAAGIEEKTLE